MESEINSSVNQNESRENRVVDLHLDRVVASQPEIGPTPPDGGYGWLIVVSAVVYQITVPAILTLYGLVILKGLREVDHEEGETLKIWDADIMLVPVMTTIIKLLLDSWSRLIVKTFNMPRFIALAGLCLTVAGVLLSSYSTNVDSNDHIVNIFAGIFAGMGCALTGQQTEMIITIYFREKLVIPQRLIRMAPTIGNCLVPILVGYLCTLYSGDAVVMIYGAIIMQNCFFLASYTRPVYIEKVIKTTYRMLQDAIEDDDQVIFSNQNRSNERQEQRPAAAAGPSGQEEDANDVVVFNSKRNAKEIMDPQIQQREKKIVINENRFSSDFSTMYTEFPSNNRFSSDFGALDVTSYSRITGYQELESIDRDGPNPQPLYRETTVNSPENSVVFATEMTEGTIRRTGTLKKNIIAIKSMLLDLNFYLYTLLHLCTTFSVLVLGVVFPLLVWQQNPSMNIWGVSKMLSMAHGSALCFVSICMFLPKSINEKARLCSLFCLTGCIGFYGITLTGSKFLLTAWCMFSSFATAACSMLLQPLHSNSSLNEFSTTATMTSANIVVAIFLTVWSVIRNYEYQTCFLTASILQLVCACVFLASSFRRRR
ncbi:uncharacterized protein LOC113509762 [Galleria mellonella]|uniref:Uncharacterized protein LOC113509762 n=1 Tax=Galleria mellonella TaxID=7137 RepID=A0A6J1WEV7_GALME|nr:uncharacterized protein LOC113509762 [Galleria mellonella]